MVASGFDDVVKVAVEVDLDVVLADVVLVDAGVKFEEEFDGFCTLFSDDCECFFATIEAEGLEDFCGFEAVGGIEEFGDLVVF